MRILFKVLLCYGLAQPLAYAQLSEDAPKLVVGIVVDQMRQDYLTRYAPVFGEDGFKRIMKNGFNFNLICRGYNLFISILCFQQTFITTH